MEIKNKLAILMSSFKIIFHNKFYLLLASILSIGLFFLFLFVINIPLFLTAIKFADTPFLVLKVFSNIMNTIISTSGQFALIIFALVTVLAGMNLSLLIFKYRIMKSSPDRSPLISFGGLFGGSLAAGCPSCSISLLAVFGFAGGLSLLPLRGVEFSILGIVALLFSLYSTGKSLHSCKGCQVYLPK